MTIIQIKRSANVAAPSTSDLVLGELAYSFDQSNNGAGAKLYIEALNSSGANVIHSIGQMNKLIHLTLNQRSTEQLR